MKVQLLVAWWLLLLYGVVATGFISWQFWRLRKQPVRNRDILKRWIRHAVILILPVLIALGPSVQGGTSSPGMSNLDVIFAVDTTPSMGALDYAGGKERIEGVKADLLALSKNLTGAHLEIITFDSEADVVLPYTNDSTAFEAGVQQLTPEMSSYSQGSSIDKPIGLIAHELKTDKSVFPSHYRLLFYLGDGEQTTNTAPASFATIASYLSGGAVLGYGTTNGAQIVKYTGTTNSKTPPAFITTTDGSTSTLVPAISKMSPAALQAIASQLKVSYIDRDHGGPATNIYHASKADLAVDHSHRVIHYLNLYWLCAIPYAGLLFWEWQLLLVQVLRIGKMQKGRHAK